MVTIAVTAGFVPGLTYSGATDPDADGLYAIGALLLALLMLTLGLAVTVPARYGWRRHRRPRQETSSNRP